MFSPDILPPWSGSAEAITVGSDAFNIELFQIGSIVAKSHILLKKQH